MPEVFTGNHKRNATSSWDGYMHQGKVGLLVALTDLIRLIEDSDQLSDWSVKFECQEDVLITKGEEKISCHQVKAQRDSKSFGYYQSAIDDFDTSGVPQNSRFIHLTSQTDWSTNANNIVPYTYPNRDKYCALSTGTSAVLADQIVSHSIDLIKRLRPGLGDDYYLSIYNYMLYLLLQEIREAHTMTPVGVPVISFEDLFSVINNSSIDNALDELEELRLKAVILDALMDVEHRKIINGEALDAKWSVCKDIFSKVFELDYTNLCRFLVAIHPHAIDFELRRAVEPQGLKSVVIYLINEIGDKFDVNNAAYKSSSLGKVRLTTITGDSDSMELTAMHIKRNPSNVGMLFEGGMLVTKGYSGVLDLIVEEWTKTGADFPSAWNDDDKESIMNPTRLEFMTSQEAINLLGARDD